MERVSVTVTLQGLTRCQCYFAEVLDCKKIRLGRNLQMCILATTFTQGAVDEVNILPHGVHC